MKWLVGILIGFCACTVLLAQDPFTLSVDVDMVLFNVNVSDNKGRSIPNLTQDNFKVYEDGREQAIYSFQPEGSPATVGLIIDNSGSMSPKRPYVVNAALTFIRASNPADEIFILNFNENVWKGLPESVHFTSDREQLKNSLMEIRADGRTALYDAIAAGLKHVASGTHQRKALVILSDGGDTASHLDREAVMDAVRKSNATIYTIGIYDPFDRDKNPGVLKELAKIGGGESYIPRGYSELPGVWEKIAGGIRGQYTIGYLSTNPSHDGRFRKVQISATGSNGKPLKVRTRPGYTAN